MYVEHVIYVGDLDPPEAGTLFTLNTLFTLGAGPAATYRRGALFRFPHAVSCWPAYGAISLGSSISRHLDASIWRTKKKRFDTWKNNACLDDPDDYQYSC